MHSWRFGGKTSIFLSVVVPLCMLTVFGLVGHLSEPVIVETVTTESVSWSMTRPYDFLNVEKDVVNGYVDEIISSNATVHIWTFLDNTGEFGYNDALAFSVEVVASVRGGGFVQAVRVKSSSVNNLSKLDISWLMSEVNEFSNLTKKQDVDGLYPQPALLDTESINKASQCKLRTTCMWIFFDEKTTDHLLSITVEIVYFDRSVYRQIDIPIILEVMIQ